MEIGGLDYIVDSAFQSPQFIPDVREQRDGMTRSTLSRKEINGNLCELVDSMEDQEGEIEELRDQFMAKIMTFVAPSAASQAPEDLGFEVEGFDYEASKRMSANVEDYAVPIADDEGEMEVEGRERSRPTTYLEEPLWATKQYMWKLE